MLLVINSKKKKEKKGKKEKKKQTQISKSYLVEKIILRVPIGETYFSEV